MGRDISIVDKLIRTRISALGTPIDKIEPSPDFTENTMMKVKKIERQSEKTSVLLVMVFGVLPVTLHALWCYVIRGDYFSLLNFPLGNYFTLIYKIIISPAFTYVIISATVAFMFYWWQFKFKPVVIDRKK